MTKEEFNIVIKFHLEGLSLEEQVDVLDNIKDQWAGDLKAEVLKGKRYCTACRTYSASKDVKTVRQEENRLQTIYSDAGYGEDDTYGEVKYLVSYHVCPNCGIKHEFNKRRLAVLWEKERCDDNEV